MTTDHLVAALLTQAAELNTLSSRARSKEAALYLLGGRDTLLALAKALQQSCPLAVVFFNSSVVVKEA